jgi:hypothetical protein
MDEKPLAEWHVGPGWQIAKDDAHCLGLGRVVAELQTLEVLLRLALHEHHDRVVGGTPSVSLGAFHLLKKGDSVAVGANVDFDDFATLKELCERFNDRFQQHVISEDLIVLRDAIAHGRVLPIKHAGQMVLKLLRFYKPDKRTGTAEVAFAELLTTAWFERQEAFVRAEADKVRAAVRSLPPSTRSR